MGRNALTNDQKRTICLYKKNNPLIKDKDIGLHFANFFKMDKIAKSTLSRILSESDTYLTNFDSKNTYRMRAAHHPEMEDALHMWYCNKRNLHIPVSDELLIEKGRHFGDEFYGLNNVDFKYSHGWLNNFKQRFGISFHVVYGESGIADPNIVKRERVKLYDITRKYQKCDVYNFDETALFYRLEPNKTLASVGTNAVGRKQYKDRITVGVCNNADGSDKYRLCVIGKYKSPSYNCS
jgi:hypothetical protein